MTKLPRAYAACVALGALVVLPFACGGAAARRNTPNPNTGGDEGGDAGSGGSSSGGKGGSPSTAGKGGGAGGRGGSMGTGGGGGSAGGAGGDSGGSGGSAGGAGGEAGSAGGAGGDPGAGGAAGSGPAPTGHLFGAHSGKYPAGSIKPTGSQDALDAAVKAAYDKWKAAYVTQACGGYAVKSTGEPNQVTS